VDVYIALTEFSRKKFIEGGLPADRLVVKPNFVDPDPGVGAGQGSDSLFVGRLTEEKGLRTLLNAWNHLYPKGEQSLTIAGDGPLRHEVEQAAVRNPGVRFVGRQPASEVYAMMGVARMLIFPSQWYEGQPKTIIESLAKGTPVVASRLGSMPEMIEHGKTGLLFDPGNHLDLARQIELLSQDRSMRESMRHAARAAYLARYTASQNYPALIECYQRAMGVGGAAGVAAV